MRRLSQDSRLHDERRRAREEGVMAEQTPQRTAPAAPGAPAAPDARANRTAPGAPGAPAAPPAPALPPVDPSKFKLIGHNYITQDLMAKVTGQAKYAEDYRAEGMLFCKLMLSPRPHARVVNIDASRALRMPGVHAILTADDLPAPPPPPSGPPPAAGAPPSAAAAGGVPTAGAAPPAQGAPAQGATPAQGQGARGATPPPAGPGAAAAPGTAPSAAAAPPAQQAPAAPPPIPAEFALAKEA